MQVFSNKPKAIAVVKLAPEPVCDCGHVAAEHRIDNTCSKCVCSRF